MPVKKTSSTPATGVDEGAGVEEGRCRRGRPLLHRLPYFIYPRGAGVEDLFYTSLILSSFVFYTSRNPLLDRHFTYTGTLVYTGTPGVDDEVPV